MHFSLQWNKCLNPKIPHDGKAGLTAKIFPSLYSVAVLVTLTKKLKIGIFQKICSNDKWLNIIAFHLRSEIQKIIGTPKRPRNLSKLICCKEGENLKDSLDSIPSPSMKIQIMGGKVCLRCKGKTLLGVVNNLSHQ